MQTTITPSVAPVTSAKLDNPAMRHGFFTRAGGVSTGLYTGLNTGLGSDDARDAVHENRRRIAAFLGLGPTAIAGCHQIHSPDVVTVTQGTDLQARPNADALVTAAPKIALSIQTADCGPVLFADQQAGIIGAAHAGWKGAVSGILENTIAAMQALGAKRKNIIAVLGPTISQANYEVGPEF
ncbi:MAG: polyphenol oxidase family protein, partial [Pseudomonadota bacterium]